MKCYSVDMQVDFDAPREIPPREGSMKPWRAVGYFQYLYCSERSKEKAKTLALDFIVRNEDDPERCQIRCDHIAWMRGVTTREQLAFGHASELTQEMFEQRDQIGIWFHTDKQYYVSEEHFAATMVEESDASGEGSQPVPEVDGPGPRPLEPAALARISGVRRVTTELARNLGTSR